MYKYAQDVSRGYGGATTKNVGSRLVSSIAIVDTTHGTVAIESRRKTVFEFRQAAQAIMLQHFYVTVVLFFGHSNRTMYS